MSERVLNIRTVVERTTLSRTEIYRRIRDEDFPPQIKLGPRRVAWRERDVDAWLAAR